MSGRISPEDQGELRSRIEEHAARRHPSLADLEVHFRGRACYVAARRAGDGERRPLARSSHEGDL